MSKKVKSARGVTVADFCSAMAEIAPPSMAQDWDNVGLIAGDPKATLRRIMLCIDLAPLVVEEALRDKVDLVMAYHPPIFKPIASLRASSLDTDAAVFRCIRGGIAIYSTHTALDAAAGGMNDVLASLCGATRTLPLDHVDDPDTREVKVTVFVPQREVERVADAMFAAGAGRIGDYDHCSFRLAGTGSFFGGAGTHPTVGRSGRVEYVEEVRLETVVPADRLAAVVEAMRQAHSYEEPAFDVYPLQSKPVPGIGRVGLLPRPTTLRRLAGKLKRATEAPCAVIVGSPERRVDRVIVVVGAAGSLPLGQPRRPNDAIITGEIRHHDALRIQRVGCTAVALGHWTSERPGLAALARRLADRFPTLSMMLSNTDREPFQRV